MIATLVTILISAKPFIMFALNAYSIIKFIFFLFEFAVNFYRNYKRLGSFKRAFTMTVKYMGASRCMKYFLHIVVKYLM
ncbi:hypothetical protein WH50_06465 [Pokkaliibacter plantistimulans]|uniref:Uncharacterized protein n=1 Tax=Pokkaliibacter plantistimulans TaxID=1635171 RepID=A0ABX5LZN7_9GAMM|nr:hypothetical protein WH50_06465 [Pokkaliibacter plantistimulans]